MMAIGVPFKAVSKTSEELYTLYSCKRQQSDIFNTIMYIII